MRRVLGAGQNALTNRDERLRSHGSQLMAQGSRLMALQCRMNPTLPWTVLLLGGASGVGKTSISYRLAQHFGVGLTEVDDFQIVLEGMTTPEQYPVLHFWRTHYEDARRMSREEHVDFFRRYGEVVTEALTLVVANHIATRTPIVLEGDFILPALARRVTYADIPADGQVRALFLYEESEEQVAQNYFLRDGIEQRERARISWWVSEWLRKEADRAGVPTLLARPWETILDRAISAVEGG
jgi:2-phosphoglycerate kinase